MQGLQTGFRNVYKVGRTMKEHVKSFHPDSSLEGTLCVDHSRSSWLCLPEPFLPALNLIALLHQGIWVLSNGGLGRTYPFPPDSRMLLILGTKDNTAEKYM